MINPSQTQNLVPNEPSLSDLLDMLKLEIFRDLNCHHVATVQSFNAANQTVYATVNYTKTFFKLNENTGAYNPYQVNYPLMIDCPLIVLGGGTTNLTFPIAQGDECLLLFNDRDIDNWFQSGQVGPVATPRLHAFPDAFALVGVNSTGNVISSYDGIRALLTNGVVKVGINPQSNKVTIQNAVTTLNAALQKLVTGILGMTAGGNPMVDVTGNVAAAATALGELLE